jgi:cell division protein FtsQ
MTKKQIWKYTLISFAWAVSLGGLVVLMSFIEKKKSEVVCKNIKVYIPGNQYFIDRDEIDKILQIRSKVLIGRRMETINLHDLEGKLKANPFIASAKVYADMDGIINVEISQRQPILRIINQYGQNFYVDQHGLKLPLSANFTARVLVANGYIGELFANRVDTLQTEIATELFKTADFIRKDSLWDAQIGQMYVNKNHDIELIPRVGNNRILLGNADSLDAKFRNLLLFYKKVLPKVGWDTYKEINIKYTNQVIGVKNEAIKTDSLRSDTAGTDSAKSIKDTSLTKK